MVTKREQNKTGNIHSLVSDTISTDAHYETKKNKGTNNEKEAKRKTQLHMQHKSSN